MLMISKVDYHFWARFAKLAYILSYIMMFLVRTVGIERNGQRRWLGIGGLSFQPTEFVKIALILHLAVVIVKLGNGWIRTKALWPLPSGRFQSAQSLPLTI